MNFLGKKSTWLQILFWGVVWVLTPMVLSGIDDIDRVLPRSLQIFFGVCIVVFVNLEILLPRLYFRKKLLFYILGCLSLILLLYLIFHWERKRNGFAEK